MILLTCVLFICIEYLQFNRDMAIQHCIHGIHILEDCRLLTGHGEGIVEYLLPMFRRLSALPLYLGNGPSQFPRLSVLALPPMTESFSDMDEADSKSQEILGRALSVQRWSDEYRIGTLQGQQIDSRLLSEQEAILHTLLPTWKRLFDNLMAKTYSTPSTATTQGNESLDGHSNSSTEARQDAELPTILLIRYEISHVLARKAFTFDEMAYDDHMERWMRICELMEQVAWAREEAIPVTGPRPQLLFDATFVPTMVLLLLKCRHLETRLRVWRLFPILVGPRENLWDRSFSIQVTRQIIEEEHGTRLNEAGYPITPVQREFVPRERRILHAWGKPPAEKQPRIDKGTEDQDEAVGFLHKADEGILHFPP